ncbi:response regulator transcription factor [Limisalsivibrio acetivorans]|uniref:response regulator transcription factor n=1 Tax=Limisalsivibrio acetivorans TaxID=1304888 RepID=UPI0003B63908|nr:response regulator [Limisalsivibrio acetivorans]
MNDKLNSKILYVEDDPTIMGIMGKFLEKKFETVLKARNGQDGLALFLSEGADVVITDLAMPVLDGFEMIKAIRRESPDVPIIITTAYRDETSALNDYNVTILHKPISTRELYNKAAEELQHLP